MIVSEPEEESEVEEPKSHERIPVRNVWLLFLYASGLAQFRGKFNAEVEESPDFKSLLARLLCYATEKRLRRNLSFGYRARHDVLRRVRGRIDILETVAADLFRKGKVACRFSELTVDTPRNRLVRAAHGKLASCQLETNLAGRCRMLSYSLGRIGVSADLPSRAEIASDQIARHEMDDRLLVSLACAVFDLILPSEEFGGRSVFVAQREEKTFPKLFEKAIGSFFRRRTAKRGWLADHDVETAPMAGCVVLAWRGQLPSDHGDRHHYRKPNSAEAHNRRYEVHRDTNALAIRSHEIQDRALVSVVCLPSQSGAGHRPDVDACRRHPTVSVRGTAC